MAGDVWRWCPLHKKWLQDANMRATRSGLESDRAGGASQGTRSSRSVVPPNCQERTAKRPSVAAAASSRWQDDGRTLDVVRPRSEPEAGVAALHSSSLSSLSKAEVRLGLGPVVATDVENVWPKTRMKRPVRCLFAETPVQNNAFREDMVEGKNWVTVFCSNPVCESIGGESKRFGSTELHQVLREFGKCGNIVERIMGPDGANWVQIQYQSSREAGLALMKSGLRLKGGLTVIVRSLDQRQRKQFLLETISNQGAISALSASGSSYLPLSYGPVDLEAPKEENPGPPKSSVSKFVDLVFDCERDYQISPAGYIFPIRFEPGLYKELFKSQVHRCDAFVTPLCDPAAMQPLYFEYPRKSVNPCEYGQSRLQELRSEAGEEVNLPSSATTFFRPTGKSVCGGSAWRVSDSQQRFCACRGSEPDRPASE